MSKERRFVSDIAVISAGQSAPQKQSDYTEDGIPFVKAGNLLELSQGADEDAIQKVSESAVQTNKLKLVPAGTILFAKSGMSCMKGIVYQLQRDAYVVSHLACVQPQNINSRYLKYFFEAFPPNLLIRDEAYPSIRLSDIATMNVPYPPQGIQQKIAVALDKSTSLISKRKEQIILLDKTAKDMFVDMFGDPTLNPKGWESVPLGELLSFLTSGSRGWAKYYSNEGEFFITIKNVKNGRLSRNNIQYVHAPDTKEAQRTRVQENDVLISITADLGRTAVIDAQTAEDGAYINQHLCLIRPIISKVVPIYLSSFLESPSGQRQFQQKDQNGVKSGLNFDAIKSVQVLLPNYELQNQFAKQLLVIEAKKQQLQSSLTKLETTYKAILQKAFNGELF